MTHLKLKILRKFKLVESEHRANEQYLERREKVLSIVKTVNVGNCLMCHESLYAAPGQQIRFHKQCRKAGRHRYGRADHVVEVDSNGRPKTNIV